MEIQLAIALLGGRGSCRAETVTADRGSAGASPSRQPGARCRSTHGDVLSDHLRRPDVLGQAMPPRPYTPTPSTPPGSFAELLGPVVPCFCYRAIGRATGAPFRNTP